jgi:hypothetical protein
MNPLWIARLLLLAALTGGVAWLHHKVYHEGWHDRDVTAIADAKVKQDQVNAADAAAATQLSEANARVSGLQLTLTTTVSSLTTKHKTEMNNANDKINNLIADVHAGKLRLSIALSPGACNSSGQNQSAGSASGISDEARADLMPETADALIRIAGDGDAAVRRANACVDVYNALKESINAQ